MKFYSWLSWRRLVPFNLLAHFRFRVCKAVHVSSSTEHDSSKFTKQNGQGDYFVGRAKVPTKGKQRWGTRKEWEEVRGRERPEEGIQQDVRVRPFGIVCRPELWENFHTWKRAELDDDIALV